MPLLGSDYDSSGDEHQDVDAGHGQSSLVSTTLNPAPEVAVDVFGPTWSQKKNSWTNAQQNHVSLQLALTINSGASKSTALTHNVPYEVLARPNQGPINPYKTAEGNALKRKNVPTGYAERTAISDATFTNQQRTFQSQGFAREPNATGNFVGDLVAAARAGGQDVVQTRPQRAPRKRQRKGDSSIVDGPGSYLGPWAKYEEDVEYEDDEALEQEELASDEEYEEASIIPTDLAPMDKSGTAYQDDMADTETTEFNGSALVDYQGRSYMHAPTDHEYSEPDRCFHPKKLIHTWKHGTKPVSVIRFIPSTAHLLLSGGDDAKIKIFDVYRDQELLRTFSGHKKRISDLSFTPSGEQFFSGSYDRHVKLWDTETGKCTSRIRTTGIPHVIKSNPTAPHEFLAGMSDKKIVQYDTRTGEMTQEYDHHLQAINTITFVDEDRRFITTSDDKSLRAWELNIPVPIKFIAEPYMYPLTAAFPHPSGKSVAFQSGDNQIVVYAAGDRFRQNRKKSFRGHNTAGYRTDVGISPDGGFVTSGDSGGWVCFWDWKSCKMMHKIKAGEGAITCVEWNSRTTSRVATAGQEGMIKYWD